ncbi:hypothetical protein J6590_066217 [Homalodisca vitripennis]|nr:hypothetical protein J6590_066217 [Homalodisca vitripennis]
MLTITYSTWAEKVLDVLCCIPPKQCPLTTYSFAKPFNVHWAEKGDITQASGLQQPTKEILERVKQAKMDYQKEKCSHRVSLGWMNVLRRCRAVDGEDRRDPSLL